ncbi:hypothetical protein V1509DRAFT_615960 [Lipomyces kononenkoae]
METPTPEDSHNSLPISQLLNTTFTIHKTTPVVGSLPGFDNAACHKYLLSLRRRILPFIELLPNNNDDPPSAAGAWTARQFHRRGMTIHSISFPSCKFVLLVRLVSTTTSQHERERELVVFTRASRQLHDVFITWLEMYFDIIVRSVKLSTTFILQFIEDHVLACHRNQATTGVRLDFTTGVSQLKTITLAFEPDDVVKFVALLPPDDDDDDRRGAGVLARMLDHMENTTGLKFAKIDLARAACNGGVIGADGRIKYILANPDAASSNWRTTFVETWVDKIAGLVWNAE